MLQMLRMAEAQDVKTFFRDVYPRLLRFVFAQTDLSQGDVDDIVQEALVHAWQRREEFLGQASLETWLFSIARHKIADHWRSRKRSAAENPAVAAEALARMHLDPLPEQLLGTVELRRRVAEALDRIDPDYARVLILRYLEDLPVRAIAGKLDESESAVESRLTRAREAFRQILGEHP